ncbi:ankyrin [Aaosphaeria arxii CBS 175.79]|uniref:Ankyrin n=1 Tax=Aaosphaeria arxii CBS 175.79 TaxID=1450172 RepID=A0A6A5XQV4_9PLEO|nr:ankyrin [Aaosphaeria arxii CBS 175.79]KAF2015552.1 ankyrin [Aaosphaeria arxii CBS 175.79]
MTKDWNSVRATIKELSVDQKKSLEDVKAIMEKKHKFRASTRAYRMKLKEWKFTRYKRRGGRAISIDDDAPTGDVDSDMDSDLTMTPAEQIESVLDGAEDLITTMDPVVQAGTMTTNILMDLLECVLDAESEKLESLLMNRPNYVNLPIGLPFEALGGRFFNHPAMRECVILQHGGQTLLDIACGLPPSACLWVLMGQQAKGSRHPLGTDLALHNAIKNGRAFTVKSLLQYNSNVNGFPETTWKPLMQAAFWNMPDITRILLDKGAIVDGTAAPLDGKNFKSALQMALEKRVDGYFNPTVRERSARNVKMLLEAGAQIHVPPAEVTKSDGSKEALTAFEVFLKPWQHDASWIKNVDALELDCLEAFIRKGADLQTSFTAFPCSATANNTFEHQVLWHSTPKISRLLVDFATPIPGANGCNLLHDLLGSCPEAKRHPADTLRDIEVLLKNGADPNLVDANGMTPLRNCIDHCPSVDVVERLQILLSRGADPEANDRTGIQPIVRAARTFSEPILSKIMDEMVKKFRGRYPQNINGHSTWTPGYFPMPTNPTFEEVLGYTCQNGQFTTDLDNMLPVDVHRVFGTAAFNLASTRFLDNMTRRDRNDFGTLTALERDQIDHVVALRQTGGVPDYKFNQDFVMALLSNITTRRIPQPTTNFTSMFISGQLPIPPSAPHTPNPIALTTSSHPQSANLSRRPSVASNDSGSSQGSIVPSTTTIRWVDIGRASKPGDLEEAMRNVLDHECKSCNNGLKLTKKEFEKHEEEHLHAITCCDVECQRRFCVAERG